MPITPEHRWLCPIHWRELSHLVRFGRAKGRYERCGRPHGATVTLLGEGRWWDQERQVWRAAMAPRPEPPDLNLPT